MAPPPEYDKEPKAPDKSATNIPCEDPKVLYNLVNEHQTNSDTKSTYSTANAEVENNKHVETLDDGQLRALLDEAITYKCPKDREGKSSLFKELLEEVEQDEQACEAAARLPGRVRRAARGRRALAHSNSLQDLVAALAAEPAPRRRHHAPVSARALHGGSLPSGVDTSFLLSEEPMRSAGGPALGAGAEYVATVRCVNPSPLAERRVSTSDAHPPMDPDNTARRSKPAFPMTYTARATLEIGSGSVGSGRAVTTTTASNQVRTLPTLGRHEGKRPPPRGPHHAHASASASQRTHWDDSEYIDKWYRGLGLYGSPLEQISPNVVIGNHNKQRQIDPYTNRLHDSGQSEIALADRSPIRINPEAIAFNAPRPKLISKRDNRHIPVVVRERDVSVDTEHSEVNFDGDDEIGVLENKNVVDNEDAIARKKYRERVGQGLLVPTLSAYNPRNVRSMTIGKPLPHAATSDNRNQNSSMSRAAEDKSVKDKHYHKSRNRNSNVDTVTDKTAPIKSNNKQVPSEHSKIYHRTAGKQNRLPPPNNPVKPNSNHNVPVPTKNKNLDEDSKDTKDTPVTHTEPQIESKTEADIELVEMVSLRRSSTDHSNESSLFIANQQRLLQAPIKSNNKQVPSEHSKIYHRTAGKQNRAPSPNNRVKLNSNHNVPIKNKNLDEDSKDTKDTPVTHTEPQIESKTEAETELVEMVSLRRSSTDHSNESSQFIANQQSTYKAPIKSNNKQVPSEHSKIYHRTAAKQNRPPSPNNPVKLNPNHNMPNKNKIFDEDSKDTKDTPVTHTKPQIESKTEPDTELVEMVSLRRSSNTDHSNEFSLFIVNQQRLLQAIETNIGKEETVNNEEKIKKKVVASMNIESPEAKNDRPESMESKNIEISFSETKHPLEEVTLMDCSDDRESDNSGIELVEMKTTVDIKVSEEKLRSAEVPSDASIFLTLYKRLLATPRNIDNTVVDVKNAGDAKPVLAALDSGTGKLPKKKKDKITSRLSRKPPKENSTKKKDIIRNALKKLFFDNITQSDSSNKLTGKAVVTASTSKQVDSAIPFSCITTPEVVASCTTTASAQAAAPLDTKMGRSALTSSFSSHGGPLPRAGPAFSAAAAVAVAAAEEFKKSLDENGNSVQGFSSPQSGSSQQKKQRRKKSSKNETVIKSHHIDGYQGNKDINEVLRFIESAEPERGERPAKRHDDKKKRSAERRKDKPPRASSLDGLRAPPPPARPQRPPRPAAPAKPERRSWGDDARDYFRDRDPEPDALELTDFQTVTKKRKPRRRADHEPRDRPRPQDAAADPDPDPPSPDRSNDSNDDMDSVHSLPALPSRRAPPPAPTPAPAPPPAPAPAPVSYADIARTRHNNIPDLIESCNYYGEGEEPPPAAPGDALAYPALEARRRPLKQAPPPAARRAGKPHEPEEPAPPAPDVVADRRPPVILLDAPARARDLDGVTFGFDVNEQLLGGARRPRCDLVRDAAAAEPPPAPPVPRAPPAPPVPRYLPPAPPEDTHHLHQIIDYVGTAWEEVVRCGGKVRYFSD